MRMISRSALLGFLAAAGLAWSAAAATAAPLPAGTFPSGTDTATAQAGDRWYRDDDDDDYYYPPPPPPPVILYEPPVYGWLPPPRPASCGKYRYWNGYRCADARDEPPYIGPRW